MSVEEKEETVLVRVVLGQEDSTARLSDRAEINAPVHVYLEQPQHESTVISVDTDEAFPLAAPRWEIAHHRRALEQRRSGRGEA